MEKLENAIIVSGNEKGFMIVKRNEAINAFLSRNGFVADEFKYPSGVLNHIAKCIHTSAEMLYVDSSALSLIEEINEANRTLY